MNWVAKKFKLVAHNFLSSFVDLVLPGDIILEARLKLDENLSKQSCCKNFFLSVKNHFFNFLLIALTILTVCLKIHFS